METVTEKFGFKVGDLVDIVNNPSHMMAARVVRFTAKRVVVYRLDLGSEYTYFAAPNCITFRSKI